MNELGVIYPVNIINYNKTQWIMKIKVKTEYLSPVKT